MPHLLLSPRELQVFNLLGEGCDIKQAAERLSITTRTAEQHRSNARSKLGIKKSHNLIVMAVQERFKANIKKQGSGIELAITEYLDGCGDDDNETKARHIRQIVEDCYS